MTTTNSNNEGEVIRVGNPNYHHQSGAKELTPEFTASIDAGKLADLLLCERWKGLCEILPKYMPPHPRPDTQPHLVVRIPIQSQHPNHEADTYSYLRHSKGPRQEFFWDCYGDDLMTIELAVLAISQAPAPYYTGPMVFKMSL